jgi:NitT/TauT family transport system ATP-binding protein
MPNPTARSVFDHQVGSSRASRIRIENVSKTYHTKNGRVQALAPTTIDFEPGKFVSVVGPSGCGKSTLLKMVAGLVSTSNGSITIDDAAVSGPVTDVGIVFQDAVLLDWRKVLPNIMLQAEIRKLDKPKYKQRALELLELVGLKGFENRYPFELSGGMKQRASIVRALLHDPPVLLMDEPFGAIDELTRDQLNLDLEHLLLRSPKTVFFVTHSVAEAVFLGDKVVVMSPRPGRIEKVFDIDLPRPRTLAMRDDDPRFGQYTHGIRAVFESVGVLNGGVQK